jgi:hypothetical protein
VLWLSKIAEKSAAVKTVASAAKLRSTRQPPLCKQHGSSTQSTTQWVKLCDGQVWTD